MGNIFVASDSQVSEYPIGGGTPLQMGTGYNSPQGIAVDASDTVYVADTGNAQIVKVAPGGQSQSTLAVAADSSARRNARCYGRRVRFRQQQHI